MAKALKIIGIILGILILLIGIGIFLLVHFIDPNKFKDEISAYVYDHTGRHLTIDGNLSWSFFPWVGFKVEDAELSNASGFGDKPFAKVDEVDLSVKVMPLLSGKVQVNNVTLNNLQINLARNANGVSNWDDIIKNKESAAPTANAQQTSPSAPAPNTQNTNASDENDDIDFSIANLTVVNSSLDWNDAQKNQHYTLSKLYISGTNVGTEQIFPLTVTFNLKTNTLPTSIDFSFNGNFNIDSALNSVAINQIEVQLKNLDLQGDISAKDLKSKPTFQGDLHVAPFNLRQLLKDFNIALPQFKKSDALQQVSTDLAFNGNQQDLSIKPLAVGIDDAKLSGNLNIKNLNNPSIGFKLSSSQFNIDNYLPAAKTEKTSTGKTATIPTPTPSTATTPASTPAATTDTPINLPVQMLRGLNLQGQLSIGQLTVANLTLNSVNANVNASNGIIKLNDFTTSLYEGTAKANASLDVTSNTPKYALNFNAQKIQAEPFLTDLMNKDFISGTATISANLNTNGNSVKGLIANLDGNSQFDFNNGVLQGVNVEYQLSNAKSLLNKQTPLAKPKDNNTPFGDLSGTIQLNNGVATNRDFVMTNKAFNASGAGTANLNTQNINYIIKIMSDQIPELKGFQIPIKVKGALTSPSISLDTDDILQQVLKQQQKQLTAQAQKAATKEVNKHIQKALGEHIDHKQVTKALGNLFG